MKSIVLLKIRSGQANEVHNRLSNYKRSWNAACPTAGMRRSGHYPG